MTYFEFMERITPEELVMAQALYKLENEEAAHDARKAAAARRR